MRLQPWPVTATAVLLFALLALSPPAAVLASALQAGAAALAALQFDARQAGLLRDSLGIATAASLGAVLLGAPLAFAALRTDLPGRRALVFAALLPLLIPPHVQAVAWRDLLPWDGRAAAAFVLALAFAPFPALTTLAGLAAVDPRLERAALLHHPPVPVLARVTWPLVRPHAAAGATLAFVLALTDYGVPAVFQVNTWPIEIFVQFSAFYDPGAAALLSLPLIGCSLALLLVQRAWMGRSAYVGSGISRDDGTRARLGAAAPIAFGLAWAVPAVAAGVPLATLLLRSASLDVWRDALATAWEPILASIGLAAAGASLSVLIAFPIAYAIERGGSRTGAMLDLLSVLPFAVPATVLGIGMIDVWNRPEALALGGAVYGTVLLLPAAYAARAAPFAVRILTATVKQIDVHLEQAAALARPRWRTRLGRIVLPLAAPGLGLAWLVAFVFGMGELGATLLIVPPGWETLSLRIYGLMHYGAGDLVAALCVVLILCGALPALALCALLLRASALTSRVAS